ncbi:hypothetical protein AK812_SmicGene5456 [Symbiodinium microadriaticum]|uniref:Uncharacterized protein n=1 Tax=Symbiodinium microadriaticum TaxID=2951 RepID=A0A1Q9ETM2_SYMMI|nr:hypothetical protein AK812_SmicGene5456 [Symbiodinium microadriaticum]
MRWLGLLTSFGVNLAGSAPHASIMEELLQLGDFDDRQRHATLVSLVAMAKVRRQLEEGGVNHTKPAFNCPEPGAGVPVKSEHVMEDFHYKKFRMWAEDYDFCSSSLGLWTGGCGAVCGLRAAVVGHMVQLRPGQLVLDAGVATSVPAQFCWMDVASQLSSRWLPARSVDLAIAISVSLWDISPSKLPNAMELKDVELPGLGDEAAPRHAVAGSSCRIDLCVLVHGMSGDCTDWDIWFQVLSSQYPSWKVVALQSLARGARCLASGVDQLAGMAADEIIHLINVVR